MSERIKERSNEKKYDQLYLQVTLNTMKTALSASVRMDKEFPLVLSSDLDGKF